MCNHTFCDLNEYWICNQCGKVLKKGTVVVPGTSGMRYQPEQIQEMDVYEALELWRDIKIELIPVLAILKTIRGKIGEHILITGEQIKIDGAKAHIHKGRVYIKLVGK